MQKNDRIKHHLLTYKLIHADHGLGDGHQCHVEDVAREYYDTPGLFIINKELPAELPDVQSGLYGPSAGDEPIAEELVTYETRGERAGPSRLIDRPTRACRRLVVIGLVSHKPWNDLSNYHHPRDTHLDIIDIKVFTAYGTQSTEATPREWWDTSLKPAEAIAAATFWSQHALSVG